MEIGFQLYSARNFPLTDVLNRIAALGYTQVEGYGSLYTAPTMLKAALEANNLTMPTAHIGLADLEDADKGRRLAETLGIKVVICPWLAPELRGTTGADWSALGERLERIAKPYVEAGYSFGYHNHDFEFQTFDGRYGMDLMLEAAPSVGIEADIAWIVRGKADAAPWLEANGERILAVHVKDLAPQGENADEGGWADVGHGVIPWASLWPIVTGKTRARYFIAEHDNPKDIERFASRSFASIKAMGV